jgi:hypothetical protein
MTRRPRRSVFARSVIAYTRILFFVLGAVGAVAMFHVGAPPREILGGALVVIASIGLTRVVEYALTAPAKARPAHDRQQSAGAPTA